MRRRERKESGNIIINAVVIALASLFLVAYITGLVYFSGHFLPNTSINGIDVSAMSETEAEDTLTAEAQQYVLTVVGREGSGGRIQAYDIGLKPVFGSALKDYMEEGNAFSWPLSFGDSREFNSDNVVDFDRAKLNACLSALGLFDEQREPEDAYLSDYDPDTGYSVVPEDPGTFLIREKAEAAAVAAVEALEETLDLDEKGCYEEPRVFRDDPTLTRLRDNLNRFVNVKLTIDYGDNSETVNGELIGQWINIDGTEVTLDESKVKEFVTHLSKAHDTFGIGREFTTSKGRKITVTGGNYGWWTDRPNTTAALTEAIKSGQSGEFTPVYFAEALVHGDSDIGDDYVEIDLDDQHVYVYKEGHLVVESDCVSGKVSAGNFTPDGTYAITYKERDATLLGENYSSPVKYWMPFNGNIGMHDASWRSSFGGDIYLTGGSHGCVNLPKSKAAEIFENVKKGEPVVVYGGKQSVPKPEDEMPQLTEEQQRALLQLIAEQQAQAQSQEQQAQAQQAQAQQEQQAQAQQAQAQQEQQAQE